MEPQPDRVASPKPTLLFVGRAAGRAPDLHGLAAEVGFRAFSAGWRNVRVDGEGARIRGVEVLGTGRWRTTEAWERVRPDVVLHRKRVRRRSARLFAALAASHPDAAVSWHPAWKAVCNKWTSELALRLGAPGVERPPTWLVDGAELPGALAAPGREGALVLKPPAGAMCRGIRLTAPGAFEGRQGRGSGRARLVAQRLVTDPVLLDGHRFDLRVYALVRSLRPLDLVVYREGVARLAARPWDGSAVPQGLRTLTGASYRKRRRVWVENVAISELLPRLARQGWDVGGFWDQVTELVRRVFVGVGEYLALFPERDLRNRFLLTGLDLLPRDRHPRLELLFLEMNYAPQLNAWGAGVDARLRSVHAGWMEDLRRTVRP